MIAVLNHWHCCHASGSVMQWMAHAWTCFELWRSGTGGGVGLPSTHSCIPRSPLACMHALSFSFYSSTAHGLTRCSRWSSSSFTTQGRPDQEERHASAKGQPSTIFSTSFSLTHSPVTPERFRSALRRSVADVHVCLVARVWHDSRFGER